MSPPERLALIGDLWNSLSDAEVPATPAQTAEIERRLSSFEQDRTAAVPWDQLKAELTKGMPDNYRFGLRCRAYPKPLFERAALSAC